MHKKSYKRILFVILLIFMATPCFLIAVPNVQQSIRRNKFEKISQYIQTVIVKSLDSYYKEYGEYPKDLYFLFDKGYLNGWTYPNPFSENKEPIRDIPFNIIHTDGNFTYLPVQENNRNTGYYILIYGGKHGYDVDGNGKGDNVYYIIENGKLLDRYSEVDERLPEIAKLLHKNK